jgi:hypothetical protein
MAFESSPNGVIKDYDLKDLIYVLSDYFAVGKNE